MERKSKLSLSVTLSIVAMLLAFTLVNSAIAWPEPPGSPAYTQVECFDTKPTTGMYDNIGTPTGVIGNVYDGDHATNMNWYIGGMSAAGGYGFAEVSAFIKPSANGLTDFAITYLDIKVDYRAVTTSLLDDRYRIVLYVDPSATEVVLQDWVTAVAASYPPGVTANPAIRTFSNVAEPNNGVWTWADVAAMRLRVECNRVGTNNYQRIYLHEVFATGYSTPYPDPETMSVQTPYVYGVTEGNLFFVDIYVTGVENEWGYEFVVEFNPDVLLPLEYMSYGPFVTGLPSEIGVNYVAVAYNTYNGDPAGFTGNTPACRIYFVVVAAGESNLHFTKAGAASVFGQAIVLTPQDGYYNTTVLEFPFGVGIMMMLAPAIVVVYLWRIRKKERA